MLRGIQYNVSDKLGIVLIGIVSILIGFLIFQNYSMTNIQLTNVGNYADNSTERIDLIDKINSSFTNFFNVLIPVFGAWIGAIIAFYFGAKNNENVYHSFAQAQQSVSEAIGLTTGRVKTVKDIIETKAECKNIIKSDLTENIKTMLDKTKEIDNVLIMSNNKPKAILYLKDLYQTVTKDAILQNHQKDTVETVLQNYKPKDSIKQFEWSNGNIITNYATLRLSDSVNEAITKLKVVKDDPNVRGIIFENDEPFGIVNLQTLTLFI